MFGFPHEFNAKGQPCDPPLIEVVVGGEGGAGDTETGISSTAPAVWATWNNADEPYLLNSYLNEFLSFLIATTT